MAKKSTKNRVSRIIDMAVAFGLGSVVVVPLVMFIKNRLGM